MSGARRERAPPEARHGRSPPGLHYYEMLSSIAGTQLRQGNRLEEFDQRLERLEGKVDALDGKVDSVLDFCADAMAADPRARMLP